MLDFLIPSVRTKKNGLAEIYPKFKVYPPSKDLMIRGGDFYAIWDEDASIWRKSEHDALRLIDKDLAEFYDKHKSKYENALIAKAWDSESGIIDQWHKFVQKQCRDSFHQLDETLIFANTTPTKENYATKALPYELKSGSTENWDIILDTLYTPEERHKIEWCIGAIVSGDSKHIQKFAVFYGSAGTGKSTVINIIQMLFDGYYAVFRANDLGMLSNQFALEPFKENPLVGIEHDGDLSRIEDNTRLNSLISHEPMNVNEKFKSQYKSTFKAFLFMGTNKPVKITDARSGIIRRLIDIQPSGNKLPQREYTKRMRNVAFELGAIAQKCLDIYRKSPDAYDDYQPLNMMDATNDFYNFMLEQYLLFEEQDGTTLKAAWGAYQQFCEESKLTWNLNKRLFKEELKNYFDKFEERTRDGRNVYSGFKKKKFESDVKQTSIDIPESSWIELKEQSSLLDTECANCPAQASNSHGTPLKKWANSSTKLKDLDTKEIHYVKVPENHIVIDFDISDNGEKSLELNLKEASKWPKTYVETSKSGKGLHLHYIYDGDPTKLSCIYDDKIEVKVFTGDSSLRRKLSLCNDIPIAHISSGLPLKKEKKAMVDMDKVADEQKLRALIKKALRKEIHPNTKPNIDFINKILDDAYDSGETYDVSNMESAIVDFALNSSNQSEKCLDIVANMKFKSEEIPPEIKISDDKPIAFFDVEVFPNMNLIVWKIQGPENEPVAWFNPTPKQIEYLLENFRLVGFNNKRYDNHILHAILIGYTPYGVYKVSKAIISNSGGGTFSCAYGYSYTDIYDYMTNGMSLKKLEIEMGVPHLELGLDWDAEQPESLWEQIKKYCINDVLATESAFDYTKADFIGRLILSDLADGTPNESTNNLTANFILGKGNKHAGRNFKWRNLAEPVYDLNEDEIAFLKEIAPEMMASPHGVANSQLPYFPGYEYKFGVSTYMGTKVGEGGYAEGKPGYYTNVGLFDIASQHPHSALMEIYFGLEFTKAFHQIVYGRVHIKHEAWDILDDYLGGKLKPYIKKVLDGEISSADLAYALKIAINSVYGLTSAKFDNPFYCEKNVDNIVAKRGALFMITLKDYLINRGYNVVHIKTDSIKIADATPEVWKLIYDFGKRYGYTFEHEAVYEKMVLVNDAVYIAKYATAENAEHTFGYIPGDNKKHGGEWTATGAEFREPFIFKTLFSKEDITHKDCQKVFQVSKGELFLDMNEDLIDVSGIEKDIERLKNKLKNNEKRKKPMLDDEVNDIQRTIERLTEEASHGHNLEYIGRVGAFVPIKEGGGGGVMYRVQNGSLSCPSGTTGYRWLEREIVDRDDLWERSSNGFFIDLTNAAKDHICEYVDYDYFVNEDIPPVDTGICSDDCSHCGRFRRTGNVVWCSYEYSPDDTQWKCLNKYAEGTDLVVAPF